MRFGLVLRTTIASVAGYGTDAYYFGYGQDSSSRNRS
jgi:hypothetical protein